MSNYRRNYINGGTWFFTVNLQDRRSQLLTANIHALRCAIAAVKTARPFRINAWVVLPEHMHCIWTLPENDADFSSRWREIKKHFTRSVSAQHIWQPRFWEHTLRDEHDYRQHVDYIYINPMKQRWVKLCNTWPFSTFHRDVRLGLFPQNWSGEIMDFNAGERA